jgi:hypothetical protein
MMNQTTAQPDPFSTPMIFLRIGWMTRYEGLTSDRIAGGGAFVKEHGYGHEIFNFQKFEEKVYGHVQAPGSGYNQRGGSGINLKRLGTDAYDESIPGVLAIWVATSPQGGIFIVGWYSNATVHRRWQEAPPESKRHYADEELGFYVTAASDQARLLPPDERLFPIPRGKCGMGQSNVWYVDNQDEHQQIRTDVLNYIETSQVPRSSSGPGVGTPRQTDPHLRQKVEKAAVKTTTAHYTELGYEVDSVESDNVGWDLNAVHGQRQLKLEVKGLSGSQLRIELTSNEYDKMKAHRESYRVCVVTDALSSPKLSVFAFSQEMQQWEDQRGRILQIDEIMAARCSIG